MLSRGWKLLVSHSDRILFTLVGMLAVYYVPLPLVVVIAVVGMSIFSYYWELVLVVGVLEVVFTPETAFWSPWYFHYTIILLLLLASIESIKRYVRL